MSRYAWRQIAILGALSLWLCVWSRFAWHTAQDDAFIHLRYADHLLRYHFITYDGVHRDFGASSLLYIGVLAAFRILTTSPDLPHVVSLLEHIALLAALILIFNRLLPRAAVQARMLALLTLVLVVTPSAVRWFQDGMETGFTTLFCVLLAAAAWRFGRIETLSPAHHAILFVLGFLMILHRVELALPVVVAFLLLTLARQKRQALLQSVLDAAPLLAGALLSAATIVLTMHAFLPDAAIAKSIGFFHWFTAVRNSAIVLAGGMNIGAGLAVFWIVTLIVLLCYQRPTLLTALANSIFPAVVFLAGLRGQGINGARYLIWTFLFSITWNILELGVASRSSETHRLPKILIVAFAVILLLDMPVESYFMHNILVRRVKVFELFNQARLDQVKDLQGVAYDIGFLGYFTQAPICDMAGLVNGRTIAALPREERSIRCAALHPSFVFGDMDQIGFYAQYASLQGWQLCGTYEFVNARSPSRHFLLASPASAPRVCAAAGNPVEALPPALATFLSPHPS